MRPDFTHANLFDLSFKLLMRRYSKVLFRLAKVRPISGSIRPVSTGIIIKELAADDVFIYETADGTEALYVEYQLEPDPALLRRWLQKVLALEEELGMPVVLLVIYLRRGGYASFPASYSVGRGDLKNHHEFEVIRLWEEADRIRSGELPELTPLLPLVEDRTPEVAVRESREIILKLTVAPEVRNELLGVCYLVGL